MLKKQRAWLIKILQDTEDDLEEESIVPVPDIEKNPPTVKQAVEEIRTNHLYHQAIALNSMHIRIGRVEAKVGLILALLLGILGLAARPILEPLVETALKGMGIL